MKWRRRRNRNWQQYYLLGNKELLNEVAPGTENPTQNAANTVQISISSESIVGNDSADLGGDESIRIENLLPKEAPSVYTSDDILCEM